MAPKFDGYFGKMKIVVAGVEVLIDVEKDLVLGDINQDIATVSASMAFWGAVSASAEAELVRADSHYRKWRADFAKKILAEDPKLAEWKVKVEIESHEDFLRLKYMIADCEKNLTLSKAQFDAYETKARTLQSHGANLRAEIATPRTLPDRSEPPESFRDDEEDESPLRDQRRERMKSQGVFKKEKL